MEGQQQAENKIAPSVPGVYVACRDGQGQGALLGGRCTFRNNGHHDRYAHLGMEVRTPQLRGAGKRSSIHRQQTIAIVNAESTAFYRSESDGVGPGLDEEEWFLRPIPLDHVGQVAYLVEHSDREDDGQHTVEEYGTFGRQRMLSPGRRLGREG